MGVDTVIRLPENVRVDDVTDVIGILVGKKAHKKTFDQVIQSEGWHTRVDGVDTAPSISGCVQIHITKGLSDDATRARDGQNDAPFVLYFFESERGGRLLSPPSTTFWIAVGKGLVKFFGGTIDYNDCDDSNIDYRVAKKSRSINAPSDGKAWYTFQERKLNLKALTKKDFDVVRKHSAYEHRV